MVWLIVVLAIVVIGIAWLAGQGRLGGMPPLVDDRPGMDLPDTDLTSDDLHQVRFAVTMRGYSMTQVDALLDRLAKQLDAQAYQPEDAYDSWLAPAQPSELEPQEDDDDNEEAGDVTPGLSTSPDDVTTEQPLP